MKVALVLTGLLRCFEQAYPSFKQYVIDRYDTDVYFDIWSEVGYYSGKGYLQQPQDRYIKVAEGDRGFNTSGQKVDANKILELYNPKSLRIEDFKFFEPIAELRTEKFTKAYTRPKNTYSQAYKACTAMMAIYNKSPYDLVVRARPDIVLEGDPGFWNPNFVYTLPSRNKEGKGTGDSILVGSKENVTKITSLMYYNMGVYYDALGVSCPHLFTQYAIEQSGCDWIEMGVGAHVAHSPNGLYQEAN